MSPSARSSRISALENMLSSSSSAMVCMASQLSEAEERERVFNGRGRWNHVRSLPDAKSTMNYLFQLASSSRCQLHDKEVMCREKELVIGELKEKVVALNVKIRQLETQVKDLNNQNMQLFTAMNNTKKSVGARSVIEGSEDGQTNATRKGARASQLLAYSKSSMYWSDDMDISDSEQSEELEDMNGGSDSDWVASTKKVRGRRRTKSNSNLDSKNTQENVNLGIPIEDPLPKDAALQCCSCSKLSFCKTKKCECRASGSDCGAACGCTASKCANRMQIKQEEIDDTFQREGGECIGVSSSDDVDDAKMQERVNKGIVLLEDAMADKEAHESKSRKPLADIGNNAVKQTGAKPKQRKNWRKSTVQLVLAPPSDALPPSSQENTEAAPRNRGDIPLRLPRAMSSAPADSNPPLTDRNAAKPAESVSSHKENTSAVPASSPARPRKNNIEKENHRR